MRCDGIQLISDLFFWLQWAADLANHMLTIYDEEVMRRQEFGMLFENHFLNTLFTGLDDMPPSFATIAPVLFDQNLPSLSKSGASFDNILISFSRQTD